MPRATEAACALHGYRAATRRCAARLVLGERRREALVDVLRRVHDDRQVGGRGGEPLPRGDAERLLVDVEHVRGELADEAGEHFRVRVGVAVDVAGPAHRQLDDAERIVCRGVVGTFGPVRRHDKRHLDAGRCERILTSAVRADSPTMVDAKDSQSVMLSAMSRDVVTEEW